jgi:hypothetical protein
MEPHPYLAERQRLVLQGGEGYYFITGGFLWQVKAVPLKSGIGRVRSAGFGIRR